jgi:hypothetical protein
MTIALKARVNVVSRSRIKYFIMAPLSWRSMTRFLASCVAQLALGCAVAPRIGSAEGVGAAAGVLDDGEDVVRCPLAWWR